MSTAFDSSHPNYEQVQQLLHQKATASPDESKRIRRQLRALGYSLREQTGGAPLGATATGTAVQRERRANEKRQASGDAPLIAPTGRRTKNILLPAEGAQIKTILDELEQKFGLRRRDLQTMQQTEWGYGFDVPMGCSAQDLMDKFGARWPGLAPEWFGTVAQGDSLLVTIGPVPAELRISV